MLLYPTGQDEKKESGMLHRKHPLYYLDTETLLVAIYLLVGDKPKACRIRGIHLPISQKHQGEGL